MSAQQLHPLTHTESSATGAKELESSGSSSYPILNHAGDSGPSRLSSSDSHVHHSPRSLAPDIGNKRGSTPLKSSPLHPPHRGARPTSEILKPGNYANPETEALDRWFEDLQVYERSLEDMANASMDQNFKEELQHVEQWFRFLSEAERTAAVYSLLQLATPVQARFYVTVLQQMGKTDPVGALLSPANPEKADMQAQLAGAMMKAELEASQRLLSVLPYQTGHVTSRPQAPHRRTMDRHSFALGDTEDYNNRVHVGRLATRGSGSPLFPSNRPRSVVEGGSDSANPFGNDWSFNLQQQRNSVVGNIGDRASLSRPHSADISTWSFGKNADSSDDKKHASSSPWGRSPTVSSFTGSMIERPNSASDAELAKALHTWTVNNGVEGNVAFNEDPKSNVRRNRNIYRAGIPGTLPESDERGMGSANANIILSMYDQDSQGGSNSLGTSYSPLLSPKAPSRPTSRSQSPAPRQSSSTGLVPLSPRGWESRPKSHHGTGSNHYGQFLNPNNRNDEFDYTSDHSDNSNVSGYSQRRRRLSSSASASTRSKDKQRGPDVVDMDLLQDVPAWFRSLRLHKYNNIFEPMKWQDIVKMNDEDLTAKGVAALGARRKMLKVFETIRQHCEENDIPY
ncbi:hypothetical protein K450DRAFT_218984 [Umbelopsis ramanniana AG]|uniref:SAM domain-containing protein n=1 Tax=Umbelopsis ramanniana AG TaxID=1314678 RepID=A0AAD5HH50_UMBRA|nr:uncharacterized protein K450DRAFT_218984 [Umbelopsis ramanniana AG]KAI8584267.1 hypothetical protein K450DRAFT_218984 [Umbelopsis ramanniana AG]